MQDFLAGAKKYLDKHHESMTSQLEESQKTMHELENLRAKWIPGSPPPFQQKIANLEKVLDIVGRHLEENIRSGEHEILPLIIKHAADIISVGLPYEHKKMLDLVSVIRERAKDSAEKSLNRQEELVEESRIKESISSLLWLMQEHIRTLEGIHRLAQDMLAKETGQDISL